MRPIFKYILLAFCTLCIATTGCAKPHNVQPSSDRHPSNGHAVGTHRGEKDTDGILSKGEIPNSRISYGTRPSANAPHRGQVDTDGKLSPGEVRNPLIDYKNRPRDWYGNHDWDHKWDKYDDGYWSRYPERRWWGDSDVSWRGNDSFGENLREGTRSGRISRKEETELKGMRADLLRTEQEYWNDGRLSKGERKDLEGRAADLRKSYRHELNDGEYRR